MDDVCIERFVDRPIMHYTEILLQVHGTYEVMKTIIHDRITLPFSHSLTTSKTLTINNEGEPAKP
jgi:hypothetical protein